MPSPTFVINGVTCKIDLADYARSVVERVDQEGPSATAYIQCPYASRYAVYRGLLGGVTGSGANFTRTLPFRYPPSPNLVCLSIGDVTGLKPRTDQASGWVFYETAVIPANFAVPTWQFDAGPDSGQNDPSGQPWTTTRFRVSAEVFSPPGGAYFIGPFPGGKRISESAIGIIRPRVEISMTRHKMPTVPLEAVMELIGSVNDEPLTWADRTFPRGCVLFAGMNSDPSNDPDGNPIQEIEYTFLGNHSVEWNEFLSADGNYRFLNTKADGTGDYPYEYVDFSELP